MLTACVPPSVLDPRSLAVATTAAGFIAVAAVIAVTGESTDTAVTVFMTVASGTSGVGLYNCLHLTLTHWTLQERFIHFHCCMPGRLACYCIPRCVN